MTSADFGMDDKLATHLHLKVDSLTHLIPILHVQIGAGDRDTQETQAFYKLHRTCLDKLLEEQELVGWRTSE